MDRKSCLLLVSCSVFALCLSAEKALASDKIEEESSVPKVKAEVSEIILEDSVVSLDSSFSDVEEEIVLSESREIVPFPLVRSVPEPILLNTSRDRTGRRILTLDGGGQRGIMQTYFMALMEERTGRSIWQLFDMIAGTSAGGMGALMAVLPDPENSTRAKYTMAQALDIMRGEGQKIFRKVETDGWRTPFRGKFCSSLGRSLVSLGGLTMPKYSRTNLEEFLEDHFGDALLSEALTDVIISAYRLPGPTVGEGQPYFFKSHKAKFRDSHHDRLMREIGGATSAAPTFFDPGKVHRLDEDGVPTDEFESYADGGLFANNPSVSATAEVLIQYLDVIEEDPDIMSIEEARFSIVSLGTGRKTREGVSSTHYQNRGVLFWVKELLSNIMIGGVSQTNHFILERLFRHDPRVDTYLRWNPMLVTASEDMDDSSSLNIDRLINDARAYTEGSFSDRPVIRLSRRGTVREFGSLLTPRGSSGNLSLDQRSDETLESQFDILSRTLHFIEEEDSSDEWSSFEESSSDIDIVEIKDITIPEKKEDKKES